MAFSYRCISMMADIGIMFAFRLAMIQSEPETTSVTINRPKMSAITLFVLSGFVLMLRKNTRCTPICAMASTASPAGTPWAHNRWVCETRKEAPVSSSAKKSPMV